MICSSWKGIPRIRNFPTTFLSLFARTLVSRIYKLLTKLIGLKSFMASAPPFLGTNTTKVALELFSNRNKRRKIPQWSIMSLLCTPSFCQNAIVNPLGPGVFITSEVVKSHQKLFSEHPFKSISVNNQMLLPLLRGGLGSQSDLLNSNVLKIKLKYHGNINQKQVCFSMGD